MDTSETSITKIETDNTPKETSLIEDSSKDSTKDNTKEIKDILQDNKDEVKIEPIIDVVTTFKEEIKYTSFYEIIDITI